MCICICLCLCLYFQDVYLVISKKYVYPKKLNNHLAKNTCANMCQINDGVYDKGEQDKTGSGKCRRTSGQVRPALAATDTIPSCQTLTNFTHTHFTTTNVNSLRQKRRSLRKTVATQIQQCQTILFQKILAFHKMPSGFMKI